MKKLLIILIVAIAAATLISGCVNRYMEGVDIPRNFPREIEIVDDAIVFEVVEDDDNIAIYLGSENDADDIGEFYTNEINENLQLIVNDWEQDDDEYSFEGIGSTFDFSIEIKQAEGREARYYKTVVNITVDYIEDKKELKENLQGNWLFSGSEGEMLDEVKRHCMYYLIDDNSLGYYEDNESLLSETYVFFLQDNQIITKSADTITDPYDISFEHIEGIDVMTMSGSQYARQHYINITDDALKTYEDINKTRNDLKGFWHKAGANGVMNDEYEGFAYYFDDYQFDVYINLDITSDEVWYGFTDENTIEHQMNGQNKTAVISFETIDGKDVMTLDYGDAVIHFEKTTQKAYKEDVGAMLGEETLNSMQGLWYMIGVDGEINDVQKSLGFAYEFKDNLFDTYNDFIMTNSDTEFRFIDANRFTYTTLSGYKVTAHILFETVDNVDVMTYTVDSTSYHFIKVDYEEFLGYERPPGEETQRKLQGFWHMAGTNGVLSDERRDQGFAYDFSESTFSTYSNYGLTSENVEFNFIDENIISFIGSNGVGYTAEIRFEKIDDTEVMTYSFNATDYHFVKTTYSEYIKGAELSKIAIGF